MKDSIRLSDKHGVNPAIPKCFFCGKDKNEILLLGRLPGDAEAPRHTVFNTEPCDQCKEWMTKGVLLMSVKDGEPKSINPYRTGGWVVVTEAAFLRMFSGPEAEHALKARWCYMEDAVWDKIGLPRGDA